MNRTELCAKVAETAGLDRDVADKAVMATISVIIDALKAGDGVQLMGFGTFEVKERKAHAGRNPATGEKIQVEESRAATFRAGKTLKDALNS